MVIIIITITVVWKGCIVNLVYEIGIVRILKILQFNGNILEMKMIIQLPSFCLPTPTTFMSRKQTFQALPIENKIREMVVPQTHFLVVNNFN